MTILKSILLENGTLTDATDGFDSVLGTPTRDTASQLKGTASMRCTAVGDFGREDVTASDTIYVSAYLKFTTLPASTQARLLFIRATTTALCSLRVTSTGKMQLRDAGSTQVGSDSATTITTGNPFRIGLRYTKGTGANAVLEAYVVAGDSAFGAAFASSTADTGTAQANRVEIGQGSSGTVCDVYVDDVKIDDASMPGPSVAGGSAMLVHPGMAGGVHTRAGGMRG
jgi:hypothetical protein